MARMPTGRLQEDIRAALRSHPKGLSIEEVSTLLSISRTTTAKYLNAMEQAGEIESRPYGPAKVYSLSERVPLDNLVSLLPHLILVLSDTFSIVQVNTAMVDFFGLKKSDLIGRDIRYSPLGIYMNEDRLSILTRAMDGAPQFIEEEMVRGDETTYFYVRIIPTVLEAGRKGLVLLFEDITTLKVTQTRLEELVRERTSELERANRRLCDEIVKHRTVRKKLELSQHEYEQLVENSTDLILKFSLNGDLIYHNPLAGSVLGTGLLAEGCTLHDICHSRNPEHEGFVDSLLSLFIRDPDAIRKVDIEYPGAGRPVWVSWTFRTIPSSGPASSAILGIGSEITERKVSEKRLLDSEHNLSDILSHLPDPTFVIDVSHRIVLWNRAMEEMTGVSSADAIGMERSLFSPVIFGYVRPVLAELAFDPANEEMGRFFEGIRSEDGVLTAETAGLDRNGLEKIFWVKATPLTGAGGQMIGAIQSMRDITDIRRMEYALVRSEGLFRSILDGSRDLIVVLDPATRYEYVNAAYESFFRCREGDIRGRSISDHPLPGGGEFWNPLLRSIIRTRLGNRVEIAVSVASREICLDCYLVPFFPHGADALYILLDFRDVTRLKGSDSTLWEDEIPLQEIGRQVSRIVPELPTGP